MKASEQEKIRELYEEQDWICAVEGCNKGAFQRAHILGNTKLNRHLYTDAVIDSKENWRGVCSLECNKKIDIGKGTLHAEVAFQIMDSDESYEDKRALINDLIIEKNELREAKIS